MPFELIEENTQKPQESLLRAVGRNVGRGALRAGEAALGLPGDIASAVLGLTNLGVNAVAGQPSQALSTLQGDVEGLLTSNALRKNITEKIVPSEYSEPQGEVEKFFDEVVSDVSGLLTGKSPIGRSIFRSLAGNASKEAVKQLGGGDVAQTATKLGVLTLAGIPGTRKALEQSAKGSYEKVKGAIAGKSINANNLYKTAREIFDNSSDAPHSKFVKERARNILNKITHKNGKFTISADSAWESGKDINKWLRSKDLPDGAAHDLIKLVDASKGATRQAAARANVLKDFNAAEEIYNGLNNRSQVGKFLEKHVRVDSLKNPLTKALLFGGIAAKYGPKAAVGATAGAFGAREVVRAYDLLSQSPLARRFYGDVIASALKGNAPALARDIARLDKSLAPDSEQQGRWELL
jgi:hypothetical protein